MYVQLSKSLQRVFLSGCTSLYSCYQFMSASVSRHTCQYLGLSNFLILDLMVGV